MFVNDVTEVLTGVRLQRVSSSRFAHAVVGQPVAPRSSRSGEYVPQSFFNHRTQRPSRPPCMPLRAHQQLIMDV